MPPTLNPKIDALQLSLEGLLKLLGSSDPDKKWQGLEILKGITSRTDFTLVEQEVATMTTLVNQVTAGIKTLQQVSKEIGGGAAGAAR